MVRMLRIAAATLALVCLGGAALAQDAALTVTDGSQTVELSRDQIDQMEQEVIETSTAWTEGKTKFSGPSMTDVLEQAGFAGETVTAEALDGYAIEIPRERLTADGAILATGMNDAALPEDKAPYWIVFPYDRSPEMNDADHQSWSAWAVAKLTVQ
jgi:hypothetical protein